MKSNKHRLMTWLLAIVILTLILLYISIGVITEYLWLSSLAYESVFITRILTKGAIFVITVLPLFFILNLVMNRLHKDFLKRNEIVNDPGSTKKIIKIASAIFSAIISLSISSNLWMVLLKFMNGQSFGILDPIFNHDMRVYLFTLPFIRQIVNYTFSVLSLLIGIMAVYQLLSIGQRNESSERISVDFTNIQFKEAFLLPLIGHAKVLIALWFITLGGIFILRTYQLLQTAGNVVFGAGYTDVTITMLAYRIYAAISVVTAVLLMIGSKSKKVLMLGAGPAILIVSMILFSQLMVFVQKLVVEPDEINKERPYLIYNISHTREGYNIHTVDSVDYPYEETLTYDKLVKNEETIKNIRVNDARPMLQTFNQIQSIRLYYDFVDVNIDRYTIDGAYTQVFITPRELNQQKLDSQAKTWVNEYLKFTHGYGVVISPVNRVTEEGQPELLMRNIPPITSTDLLIQRPEIYFGELTNRYVLVNTLEKEFDYPSGDNNVESLYEGADGIRLSGLKRLIFAINQRSMKLLVSNNINSDSRIMLNRNIMNRVRTIAPFLTYDDSPYIVLNQMDGKLYWIIDAYTTSGEYPYSEKSRFKGQDISYIRNSVKVVIDLMKERPHIISTMRMILSFKRMQRFSLSCSSRNPSFQRV
ncbi:MAG TPA: hypothetical protein DCS67_02255 [Clostridiales bacterium UBA8960]|nr:hypothetical protein [Clostridiales bacterium UBA8960]